MTPFHTADWGRRQLGATLGAMGAGPVVTPSTVVLAAPQFALHDFGGPTAGPAILIVPAPIKRAYIWDLLPAVSVVRSCGRAGFRVFMVSWQDVHAESDTGLAAYAGAFIDEAVGHIVGTCGARPMLLGHSLGGTFVAIYAARGGRPLAGAVLIEAPLCFGPGTGALSAFVRNLPAAEKLAPSPVVPGSLLSIISTIAAPAEFEWARLIDRLSLLGRPDRVPTHVAVERWMLDEFPVPRPLFVDVVEELYKGDKLVRGALVLDGAPVAPAQFDIPVLAVFNPESTLVPPAAVLPFVRQSGAREVAIAHHPDDLGVALPHVGALVGQEAHRRLWPRIHAWMRRQFAAP